MKIKKSISLILILLSVFSIVPKSVSAQNVSPPSSSYVSFKFIDSDKKTVRAEYRINNTETTYFNFAFTESIPARDLSEESNNRMTINSDLRVYSLLENTPGSEDNVCTTFRVIFPVHRITTLEYTIKKKIVLIIGNVNSDRTDRVGGIFLDDTHRVVRSTTKYLQLENEAKCYGTPNDNLGKFIKTASNCDNAEVYWALDSDQKDRLCNSIITNWNDLKNNARDMLIPFPGSEEQRHWIKIDTTAGNPSALANKLRLSVVMLPVITLMHIKNYVLEGKGFFDSGEDIYSKIFNGELDFEMTEEGKRKHQTILEKGKEIKDALDKVVDPNQINDDNYWPCSNKLTGFKWSESETATPLKNVKEFQSALDTLLANYQYYVEGQDAPTSEYENQDIYCQIESTGFVSLMFQAFCGMTIGLKDITDSFFIKAIEYMELFIGIETKKETTDSDTVEPASEADEESTPGNNN